MAYEEARSRLADHLAERYDLASRVVDAMRTVPRHVFVPEDRRDEAYADRPLPIGHDQTISAPHMVAVMADRLDLSLGETVLEVGTGCGYHAAVTAELVGAENVYSVEYVPELARRARETLAEAGYGDVRVRQGDGREGWPAGAPYDAAYCTCAAPDVPDALIEQTRAGGRVLAPVGDVAQRLVLVRVHENGTERERLGRVRFVRMQ